MCHFEDSTSSTSLLTLPVLCRPWSHLGVDVVPPLEGYTCIFYFKLLTDSLNPAG